MDPTFRGLSMPTPSPHRPSRFPRKLVLIVIGAVVVIAIGIFLLMSSNSNATLPIEGHLSARLDTLSKIVTEGQQNLTSETLKKVNSDVSIVIASDTATLQSAFEDNGLKKVDKTILADEADDDTFTKLETADVNGQFDDTYKTVLSSKLESTNALVKELFNKTKSKSLKAQLNEVYGHIQLLQNELATL